ncbi:MAG: domain S-box [Schlesneria sp.]|nr:domain S-box [Schlesneria sp.]
MTIALADDVIERLQRLEEAEETLRAIRSGEIDAVVVESPAGERVFTLSSADHAYRNLIEAAQQGAATLTSDGTVSYCNRAFAAFFDRTQWDIAGTRVTSLLPFNQQHLFESLLGRSQTQNGQGEFLLESAEGAVQTIHIALTPMLLGNHPAICLIVTDITKQKEHQDLQDSNRRKDEFLAMLAHELRNPLAPISNAIAILNHLMKGDDKVAYVSDIIDRQTRHLSRLVDDLLDVSRISLGKIKLQKERVDLATIIARAAEISTPLLNARKHQLTVQMPPTTLFLEADGTRLAQVISNLLTNAAKYTDEGGSIFLSTAIDGDEVVIRVLDSGMGISAELLPQIFDLFIQGDRSLARSEGGLGIGLTLVRRLVELHGGTVKAASDGLGCGSEFTVRLPAFPPETTSHETAANSNSSDKGPSRQIMVVDDNKDAATTIGMLINLLGHEVTIANSSLEALELAKTTQFQAVFLDIGLPGMNGHQLARCLRALPDYRNTLLVAMTGYGQEEDINRSIDAGFNHHCVKPIELQRLSSLLQLFPTPL